MTQLQLRSRLDLLCYCGDKIKPKPTPPFRTVACLLSSCGGQSPVAHGTVAVSSDDLTLILSVNSILVFQNWKYWIDHNSMYHNLFYIISTQLALLDLMKVEQYCLILIIILWPGEGLQWNGCIFHFWSQWVRTAWESSTTTTLLPSSTPKGVVGRGSVIEAEPTTDEDAIIFFCGGFAS